MVGDWREPLPLRPRDCSGLSLLPRLRIRHCATCTATVTPPSTVRIPDHVGITISPSTTISNDNRTLRQSVEAWRRQKQLISEDLSLGHRLRLGTSRSRSEQLLKSD